MSKSGYRVLVLALAGTIVACADKGTDTQAPDSAAENTDMSVTQSTETPAVKATADLSDNPIVQEWTAPFGAPPFGQIEERHYIPAFEEGMRINREEIRAIADNAQPPTFANTIEALDRAGELLGKVSRVFFSMTGSNTNPELQKIQADISPRLSRHNTDIFLDSKLFARVKTLKQQAADLGLNEEQAYVLTRVHRDFERAGANLDDSAKARLNEVNQEISSLTVKYGQNLLAENNAFQLVLNSEEELAGLPDFVRAAASETARQRDQEGSYLFTLTRSSMTPFLQYSTRRDLREKIFSAWTDRGTHGNEHDNLQLAAQIAALRVERANLLGFKTHADWVLQDRMAETPKKVYDFMRQVWEPALAKATEERAALQEMADSEGGDFQIQPWDWFHYAEKVRKARYNIDDEILKPYFKLENIRDAAFMVANKLWGITFHELEDMPIYQEDVQVFEVRDFDGSHLAVFYFDFHPRQSKRGGAWMSGFRAQSKLDGDVRPIVINNCNFPKGSGDIPTLLSFGDASTLFHEFGHGLHGLMSDVTYRRVSGVSGPRDYTEFPAQLMEHWIGDREVLRVTARHYQTGEPISEELMDRLEAASKFNQGYATIEYLSAAFLDMDWHTLESTEPVDTLEFERSSLESLGLIPEIVVRYRSTYFSHIFSGPVGYSSGYYSYIWSEILDADGFEGFKESGNIFDPELASRMRQHIYASGGTDDAMKLYVKFRGREPSIDALLRNRGFK